GSPARVRPPGGGRRAHRVLAQESWLRRLRKRRSRVSDAGRRARRARGLMLRTRHGTEIAREHQICSPCSAAKALSRSRIGGLPLGPSISGCIRAAALPALRSSSIALTGPTADGESENER